MADQGSDGLLDLNPPGMTADEVAGKANTDAKVIVPDTERVDDPSLLREPEVSIAIESLAGIGFLLLSVASDLLWADIGWVQVSELNSVYMLGVDHYSSLSASFVDFTNEIGGLQGIEIGQDSVA